MQMSTRVAAPPMAAPSVLPGIIPTASKPSPAGILPLPMRPKYISSSTVKPTVPPAAVPLLDTAKTAKQQYSTAAIEETTQYAAAIKWLHWLMAGGIISAMLLIQAARAAKGEQKGYYMMLHKSIGFTIFFLISYRTLLRFTTKIPAHLPGPNWEHWASTLSHMSLYGFMWFMPVSGILMGYFGGKGIPFFGYTVPGKKEPVGSIAKASFQYHKLAGLAFEYFLPLHIGAAFYHRFKGQWIFERVNPFAAPRIA